MTGDDRSRLQAVEDSMTMTVKIRYHQGELGFAGVREDGLLVIDNLPFDGGLVNFDDVVRCRTPETPGEPLFVSEILERRYHAWSSVRYMPPTLETYTALRLAVEAAGGRAEGAVPGSMVVASNVEDQNELLRILGTASVGTAISVAILRHVTLHPAPIQFFGCDPNRGMPAPGNIDTWLAPKKDSGIAPDKADPPAPPAPPGPRWFVGVSRNDATSSIRIVEGHSSEGEAVSRAFMREVGVDIVYAFLRSVDLRKIIPVLQRGESLVAAFTDDIDTVYFNQDNVDV